MYKNVMLSLLMVLGITQPFETCHARESRGLDDLATINKSRSKCQKMCAAAAYSKEFDDWANYYLNGNMKKSDEQWGKVLALLKNVDSTTPLMKRAVPRLVFADIPKGSPLKKVEIRDVFMQWLRVSKAKKGVNHRFVGDAYASMANYYEGQRIYRNAAMFRKKQFEVYKVSLGATNRMAIRALYYSAKNLFLAKDYTESEKTIKQVLKLSEKAKFATGTRESVKLYLSLLRTTNRKTQAKELTDKYKRFI